jgi:hypothetical protein
MIYKDPANQQIGFGGRPRLLAEIYAGTATNAAHLGEHRSGTNASSFDPRRPVEHHGERRALLLGGNQQEEFLTIRGDIEVSESSHVEERFRDARV